MKSKYFRGENLSRKRIVTYIKEDKMVETVAELEGSLQHWDMFSDLYRVLREQSAVGRTRLALPIEKICQKENLRIRSALSA